MRIQNVQQGGIRDTLNASRNIEVRKCDLLSNLQFFFNMSKVLSHERSKMKPP